jgi:hypothetical protein
MYIYLYFYLRFSVGRRFQKQYYISFLEDVHLKPITEKERRRILDLYIPAREEHPIENINRKKGNK